MTFLYHQNNSRIGKKQRNGVSDSGRFTQVENAGQSALHGDLETSTTPDTAGNTIFSANLVRGG
jgi:hypothetical protein